MQQKLLLPQLLQARQAAAALQVLGESRARRRCTRPGTAWKRVQILLDLQPAAQVVLVGEILIRHVARIAAVGHLADGIDAEERDDGPGRVAADLVVGNQPLAGDDELLGGAGQVEVGDGGAADAAVAVAVGLVDVDGGHVGVEGRQRDQAFAGERTGDLAAALWRNVSVPSMDRAGRNGRPIAAALRRTASV